MQAVRNFFIDRSVSYTHLCKEWLFSWDKRKMWELADLTLSRDGLVKGDRFIKELKQIIPDMNIEDLPVPYVAMATDIVRDQEVRFDRGSLHEAIRASISIPMLFRPLRKDGMVLIDGGILNLSLLHICLWLVYFFRRALPYAI